jgi:hypothetical protein
MNKTALDSFIQISENFRNFIEEKRIYVHHRFYNGLNAQECKKDLYKKVCVNLKSSDYFCMIADMYDSRSTNLFFGNKKTIEKTIEEELYSGKRKGTVVLVYDFNQDKPVRFKSKVSVELDS